MKRTKALGTPLPHAVRWSKAEDRLLGRVPDAEVARRLKRSLAGVQGRRLKLGIRSRPNRRWTKTEERWLGRRPDTEVARLVGRSVKSVEARRCRLGLKYWERRNWSEAEKGLMARAFQGPWGRGVTRELAKKLGRPQASLEHYRRANFGRVLPPARSWTRREERLLGTRSDKEVARLLGCKIGVVTLRRHRLGIAAARPPRRPWTPAQDRLLGTAPDHVVGRKLGRTFRNVQHRRAKLGIAPAVSPWAWKPAEVRLLGTMPDRELARRLGRTVEAVQRQRVVRKIPSVLPTGRRWTPREDALLGTKIDAEVGRLLGRGAAGVRARRKLLHIRLQKWRTAKGSARKWTRAEEKLLGTMPDWKLAKQLGRSCECVAGRRRQLRRPAIPDLERRLRLSRQPRQYTPPREWTLAELRLLGTRSDREIARKLGRTEGGVQAMRQGVGVLGFRVRGRLDAAVGGRVGAAP